MKIIHSDHFSWVPDRILPLNAVPLNVVLLLALIYQTSVKTGADSGVKIILRPCEIHELCESGQFQRTNEQVLKNVVGEKKKHVPIYAQFGLPRF